MNEELLGGGLANAGAVWRRGVAVRRPAPPHAPAVHRYLTALRATGFHGAPTPRKLLPGGLEELEFIAGDVPIPPYPTWSATTEALMSVGTLLRKFHDASSAVAVETDVAWPTGLADPHGGSVVCHNDVCPENVVFRDWRAVALIDFDFAAPGRPEWDLAMTARMWVPVLDPTSAAVSDRAHLDVLTRVRALVDAYGLAMDRRPTFVDAIGETIAVARSFVGSRVAADVSAFVEIFEAYGGWERWDRIDTWFASTRDRLTDALM